MKIVHRSESDFSILLMSMICCMLTLSISERPAWSDEYSNPSAQTSLPDGVSQSWWNTVRADLSRSMIDGNSRRDAESGLRSLSTSPVWTTLGEQDGDNYASSVSTAGDVNGDGYDDVLVTAPGYPGTIRKGRAYVFLGSPNGPSTTASWTFDGENDGDALGSAAATAGDVNGDGYSDVIVSAVRFNYYKGKVYCYLGSVAGLSPGFTWSAEGENFGDQFGLTLSSAADVNGDGFSDVIVGAAHFGPDQGKVYCFIGSPAGLSLSATWTQIGENYYDGFGKALSTAGDINGDSFGDILVGAPHYGSDQGKSYCYFGSSSGLSTTPGWIDIGESVGDQFGASVSLAGDVNGDGFCDILVGAPQFSEARGRAYLYTGAPSGPSAEPVWTPNGKNRSDQFGSSLFTAGDVNGDGYADILVAAVGFPVGSLRGKTFLYQGSTTGVPLPVPAWTDLGENAGDEFGGSYAPAGDVNGDGFSDIVVGAPELGNILGKAYLYFGMATPLSDAAAWLVEGAAAAYQLGWSVGKAGDINGDGFGDIIVGAYGFNAYRGIVSVFFGSTAGLASVPDWTVEGENLADAFGWKVDSAGDVNGDGYEDIIISAVQFDSDRGKVYVFHGFSSGLPLSPAWTATGEHQGDRFGESISAAGDVNGDSIGDIIVGASGHDLNQGKAYGFSGTSVGLPISPSWTAVGEFTGDHFGFAVASAGDVNSDGYGDVMVGAYGFDSFRGQVCIFQGAALGTNSLPTWTFLGEQESHYFGYAITGAGDTNGDGFSDVLISAPFHANERGKVYLFSGSGDGPLATPAWTAMGEFDVDQFGSSVAAAGDVNGDGFSDVMVSAENYPAGMTIGRVFLFLGSLANLATDPDWITKGEADGDTCGHDLASCGDINGDGFGDIIIGTPYFGDFDRGKASLYLGGGGYGISVRLQQKRYDLLGPVAPLGMVDREEFRVGIRLRSPFGRGKVRLQWQLVPLADSFNPAVNPFYSDVQWADSTILGLYRNQAMTWNGEPGPLCWRLRTRYNPVTTPFQTHGRWMTLAANALTETDLRNEAVIPCTPPDKADVILSGFYNSETFLTTFTFQDPNQPVQRTGWNIRKSNDPSLPKDSWPLVNADTIDMDEATPDIQWIDYSTDDPGPNRTWFYQITTYNHYCPAEGPF